MMKNWDKWQTFRKDRGAPPWIKVHRKLMTNPEWAVLSDAEKGQLVSMWLVAADNNGRLPSADMLVLRKICQLDEAPNISKFKDLGFIDEEMAPTRQPGDNQMTSGWQPSDAPEESRGEESRGEKRREEKDSSDNSGEKSAPQWREKFAPEVVEFVEHFQGYVAQTQGAKAPKVNDTLLKTCADTVDKLIRIDKHSLTTVVDVMRWAVADEFWSSNVLSLASLRKKKEAGGQTKFQKILAAYERTSVTSLDVLNEMVRRVEGGKRTEAEGVCADIKTIAPHSGTGPTRHAGTEADPGNCGTLVGGGRAQAGGDLDSW